MNIIIYNAGHKEWEMQRVHDPWVPLLNNNEEKIHCISWIRILNFKRKIGKCQNDRQT